MSCRRGFSSRIVLWLAGGVGLALIVALAITALVVERIPPLTPESLAAAEARWKEAQPTSYRLQIAIGGKRSGRVEIEVERGEITKMTRDGLVPHRRATWQAWSVPGMFDTLRQELELAEQPERSFGVAERSQIIERARFDEQYGYPARYQRSVLGSDQDLDWRVVSFAPID